MYKQMHDVNILFYNFNVKKWKRLEHLSFEMIMNKILAHSKIKDTAYLINLYVYMNAKSLNDF